MERTWRRGWSVGVLVWVLLAPVVAVVIGRGIRLADVRSPGTRVDGVLAAPDRLPGAVTAVAVRR